MENLPDLDLEKIRSYFPSLAGEWVFMDNAGGSQTLRLVADRISDYLLHSNVQHGASYQVSQLAQERVQAATAAMATLVNATDPQEIVMGPSATFMFRLLSICLSAQWSPGDEVIVTNTDHEANVSPWFDLEKQGIKTKIWKVNPDTLQLDLKDLGELLSPKTKLVAVTHTSNVLGTINPIREIADMAHQHGALLAVDGVAHAPHRLVDVQALDADFYVCSLYKVYGPHYALMYGKKSLLLEMQGLNHYFITRDQIPYKFQPGNVNFELAYGAAGLPDYLGEVARHHYPANQHSLREEMALAFELFTQHEAELSQRLMDYLSQKASVRIIGEQVSDADKRVATVSFVVDNQPSDEVVNKIDPYQIGIRYGDFYAKKLIQALNLEPLNGVVRISLVHYNSRSEVDRLIDGLEASGLIR